MDLLLWKPVSFRQCSRHTPWWGAKGPSNCLTTLFIPWEKDAVFTVRGKDQEVGQEHVTPGADEYLLMVEHFADAVLGKTELTPAPEGEYSQYAGAGWTGRSSPNGQNN